MLPQRLQARFPGLALLGFLIAAATAAADETKGAKIYENQCTACHGAAGEGTEEYPHVLAGDKSVLELARLIEKTMPKDSPQDCTGDDARQVAAYIYNAFYSRTAQVRNKPLRVELSRLTVRQYRNAVADLVGSFRPAAPLPAERGLRGEYFKSRRFRTDERMLERVDERIHFDFGEESPEEKIDKAEFGIRWQGSIIAPDTGEYEFALKTQNGARLWVNDNVRPLIDAWVRSGRDSEYRESIFLLGGRAYPVRLEMFKSKESKEKTAAISLLWKRPHHSDEVIGRAHLSPTRASETMIISTPFPPDDRSVGYERGAAVSKEWDAATTDAAIEAANYVVARLDDLMNRRDSGGDRSRFRRGSRSIGENSGTSAGNTSSENKETGPDAEAARRQFCRVFVERAFRRPLTDEQARLYIDRQFEESRDWETAIKRVVLLTLKSPRFLYREIGNDPHDIASRLSFGLWDSLPDEQLLKAAAAGELTTDEQIAQQAERMANDPRATSKLREFFLTWLKVDQPPDLSKDPERFPEFDARAASDLRTSLEMFLDDVLASETADFRELLLADSLYLNGRLARLYGADLPEDAGFQKVSLENGERAGVLTHPYLLAGFAYTASSSPIHRGVFVSRSLLGRALRPPPEAVAPLAPDLHPSLTTRERVLLQTSPQSCQMCHGMINSLGFTLEHFDAIGRYRSEERGKPVDASGSYQTRSGEMVKLSGPRELAKFLAGSEETRTAVAEQLFQHLVKQPIQAYGPDALPNLTAAFAENNFNLRRLMVEIMLIAVRQPESQR